MVSITRPSSSVIRNSPVSSLMFTKQSMRLLICFRSATFFGLTFAADMLV